MAQIKAAKDEKKKATLIVSKLLKENRSHALQIENMKSEIEFVKMDFEEKSLTKQKQMSDLKVSLLTMPLSEQCVEGFFRSHVRKTSSFARKQ